MEYGNRQKFDNSFLEYASNILAQTDTGLTGSKIVKLCNFYAIKFNKTIPYNEYPFDAKNKRMALLENLQVFDAPEQFIIIKKLCESSLFNNNDDVQRLKIKLYDRYGEYATKKISNTELIKKTEHWLADYPEALKQYKSGLIKYENGIFERNTLDDMRLSFELLVKDITGNNKSLENQESEIGTILKNANISKELRNMIMAVISYYEKFQNQNVKHNDKVNKNEIEFVIEITSMIMKFMIQVEKFDG